MAENVDTNFNPPRGMERLRGEHLQVVQDCKSQMAHWKKVQGDYESLQQRLSTLPDKLSYEIMVPFGSLAFMPGKLVHTNELTVLLGDNWFAECSAKQAHNLVEHRKKHVKSKLDDLHRVVKNFENRASFTEELEKMTRNKDDFVDIREEVGKEEASTKGRYRVAHKPNSKPREEYMVQLDEEEEEEEEEEEDYSCKDGSNKGVLSEEELWARLDELERLEEEQDDRDRMDSTEANGEDTTSSSSEEEKEPNSAAPVQVNGHGRHEEPARSSYEGLVNGIKADPNEGEPEKNGEVEEHGLPTIYFSHTVEPKKVRINTGKNTTLKFSERKEKQEQAKRKKKNGQSNGLHEHHKITTPTDLYRLFVDVVNGEPVPRKSILKSRSRENSVCSDTSESSAADFEERRAFGNRSLSHDDATHSDTSDGVTEEDSPISLYPNGRFEAFSGTVIEKEPLPSQIPHLTIAPPALPTILERKQEEVGIEAPPEAPKRVSKFKAARQLQK